MVDLPNEARLRWILSKCAALVDGGAEPVGGLVLPTSKFFPDQFDGSTRAVERLLERVVRLAGLSDIDIELEMPRAADDLGAGGGCSSGACGTGAAPAARVKRVQETEDGYRIAILPQEVGHSTILTTAMVRAVSHIFMREAELYDAFDAREAELAIDLVGTMLGFGALLCNGAYIYAKSCGGVKVASATKLPVEELSLALAIYCKLHSEDAKPVRRHLDTTPRAHFDESCVWVESNSGIIRLLRTDPEAIMADSYSLSEARSWFSRLFGLGKARGASVPTDEELERLVASASSSGRSIDEKEAKRLAAIRELVDESFDSV